MNNMKQKILSLLVLLLTAASGAWAQTIYLDFEDNALPQGWTHYGTSNNWYVAGINSKGNVSAYAGSYSLYIDGNGNYNNDYFVSPAINFQGAGSLSFAYATKDWSGDCNDLTIAYSTSPTGPWTNTSFLMQASNDWTTATVDLSFLNGTYYIAFVSYDSFGYCTAIDNISLDVPAETIEVTTNKAEGETTFTEATFNMPDYDATVEYELVRDMSVEMPVTVGDGTEGYRIRLKKNGSKWEPADMTPQAMAGLIAVTDNIEMKVLTNVTDYTVSIYAIDDNDQPTGDAISFANLEPGRYVAKAVAKADGYYIGETALSNVFVLFQGYEVEVGAGEYATYYKDENLYLDEEDAELYTLTSVDAETATATQLSVAKAYTPILVKNTSATKKTIVLIPTETEGDNVEPASEFIGTLTATTIAASDETQNNYAFNGKQFVRVKNAIEVGANKCWLSIPTGSTPMVRAISIVFDSETTGISTTGYTDDTKDTWYDLNGCKLDATPTKKGIYIVNGKKVVIK